MILWNFWLCDSMKDFGYVCIWTCSIFILSKEYSWIGWSGPVPKFCFGSFGDILFWFFQEHSDSGIERTSAIHRGDFLGSRQLSVLFYSEWLSMQFTNLVRQYNIHRDPNHMVISFLFYALCLYMRYLLSVILTIMLTV